MDFKEIFRDKLGYEEEVRKARSDLADFEHQIKKILIEEKEFRCLSINWTAIKATAIRM